VQELNEEFIHVQHTFPRYYQYNRKAIANVGRTMFETDRLPEQWVRTCNRMDEIWVPTDFNIETFSRSGVDASRLFKIPGCMPAATLDSDLEPLELPRRRGFSFLSVFDWSLRKGWDVLLRAFTQEFGSDEGVCLYLRVHSSLGYTAPEIREQMEAYLRSESDLDARHLDAVVLLPDTLSSTDMLRLYRSVDAYVMPTRGEGWGRPYMEAMAAGLPVIGTGWSGHTEFMKKNNSYLIDYQLEDVPDTVLKEVPLFAGHKWAEPSAEHLRSLLREVSKNGKKPRQRAAKARKDIDRTYRATHVARLIQNRLEHLHQKGASVARATT
jgi:glycosyltransferase involved in cell wall biosynthesis